jgi:hypothetical protein
MQKPNSFKNLNFQHMPWYLGLRLIVIAAILVIFMLAWWIIPHEFLFFLLVPALAMILWAASYGWRISLSILLDWLHYLEQL